MSHTALLVFGLLGVGLFLLIGIFGDSSRGGRRFFHLLAVVFVLPLLFLYIWRLLDRQNS